ncbi:hypothetical protein J6590_062854 [Homalodisca vitripennis]|nr:hypothetical protein J6590_062854 [Homalodisca vitripennis]
MFFSVRYHYQKDFKVYYPEILKMRKKYIYGKEISDLFQLGVLRSERKSMDVTGTLTNVFSYRESPDCLSPSLVRCLSGHKVLCIGMAFIATEEYNCNTQQTGDKRRAEGLPS